MLPFGTMEERETQSQQDLFGTAIDVATKHRNTLIGDNPALWFVFIGLAFIDVLEFLALTGFRLEWLDG